MADQVSSLSIQISSDASRAAAAIDTLIGKLSNLSSALGSVNGSGLNNLASGVTHLSSSMMGFKAAGVTKATFSSAASGLQSLNGVDTNQLSMLASSLNHLNVVFNNIGASQSGIQSLTSLASAMSKFGGKNVGNASGYIAPLASGLQSLSTALNGVNIDPAKVQGIADLAVALRGLGSKSIANAATNLPLLTANLGQLFSVASQMPMIKQNTIDFVSALGNLGSTARNAGTALNTFGRIHLPTFGKSVVSVRPKIQSLGFAIWKLYAQLLLARRIMSALAKPVEVASALTEIQNVIDHTFGDMQYKLKELTQDSIQQFGMSELSVKRYAARFQAMGVAMGITNSQVKTASDNLTKLGATLNTSGDSLADMSVNLTKLVGDLASFYDEDQAVVAEKLNAVFTGMARPLRAYGIDLTQATLQEWALKNGIDANVASMTQAEKTMLRYQYVMANTQNIAGDFARTADTWANQVRQLKQNFEALGATMGGSIVNALKPVIKALNSAVRAVTGFAKVVSDALGFIFGWKYEEGSGGLGGIDDTLADAADAAGDMEKGTGGAADNAKKLKSYLLGIDELNVLEPDNKGSGGGGGGGGSGSGGGASATDADGGRWTKSNSALTDYMSNIDSLFDLGDTIGKKLADMMNGIDWNKVYEKARGFGSGLAHFLNGLISPELFGALGKTIAASINTALQFLNSFGTTFNWRNFGISIATGINNFFKTFDPKLAADTLNTFGHGLLTSFDAAVRQIQWSQIGTTIGTLLANINWAGAVSGLVHIIGTVLQSVFTTAVSMMQVAPLQTAILGFLAAVFAGIKIITVAAGLINSIKDIVGTFKWLGSTIVGTLGATALPIVAAGAGLALLVGWIDGVSRASAETSGLGQYADALDRLSNQTDRTNESIRTSISTMQDHVNNAGAAEMLMAQDLADEYFTLSEKTNLTVTEQMRMRDIAQQLAEIIPGVNGYINEETGLLETQKSTITGLIEQTDAYYKLQASRELLLDAYKAQVEAEQNLKNAQEGQTQAVQTYLTEMGYAPALIDAITKSQLDLNQAQIDFENSPNAFKEKYGVSDMHALKIAIDDVATAQNNVTQSVQDAQETLTIASENVNSLKLTIQGYADTVNSIEYSQMVLNTTNAIDEMGGIWEGGRQVLGEKAIAVYNEIKNGLSPNDDGYYTLANGDMVRFGEGLTEGSTGAVSTLTETMKNDLNTILGEQGKQVMYENGQYIVTGLTNGITESTDTVEQPINDLANKVNTTFESAEEIGSPSKKFEVYGQYIVEGFNQGITSNYATSQSPIETWAKAIQDWFTGGGNGTDGKISSLTFQNKAREIVTAFSGTLSTAYLDSQAPVETWVKGIITWFTGDGSGEDKINKVAFTKFATDIITAFKDTITQTFEQTKEPMDAWVKGLLAWFTGESGNDEGFVTQATWTKFAETIVEAFKTTIQQKYTETQEPLETWAKSMVRWMNLGDDTISTETGLGKKFYDIGDNAMQGLINGLKSRLEELREVCEEIASAMEDAMEEATEEHSPSRVWMRIGSFLTEGLAIGLKKKASLATNNATEVAEAVNKAYKPFMPSYSTGSYGIPSGGGNIDSEGIQSGLTAMMTSAMNSSNDTALMQQQNEILTRIANKNTNVYMDGKKTDALLKQAQKRSGFTFRPQMGNA